MLNLEIDAGVPVLVERAVSFETGATRAQAADPSLWAYEHHGESFGWADPGALTCFFDDLVHGRPMPPKFASKALRDIDVLIALTLHHNPDLVFLPNAFKLVNAADFVHRRGAVGMAHVDQDLMQFFRFLRGLFPKTRTSKDFEDRIEQAVDFIKDYIGNDQLPQLGGDPEPPTILDTGTRRFVVAETGGSLGEAWVHLFRNGFARGVVFSKDHNGRRNILGTRRGPYVSFNLEMAARLLNDIEKAMGEPPEWGNDALWLYGPPDGSLLLVTYVLEVLTRV